MRVMVILNPKADQGHGLRKKDEIVREGQKWGGLDLVLTQYSGHGHQLARTAVEKGYEIIVAAGGDGTVHEVVNGLMTKNTTSVKLGVIPVGSGNDFAYAMDIPLSIPEAVEIIFMGYSRTIDLGFVSDDRDLQVFFDNNLGVGFDANVVIRVEAVKRLHGFPKYLWGVLKTLVLDFRPLHYQMRFDQEIVSEDVLFVTFGLGPRHGGGFLLTPDAVSNDDLIDTCTVRPMGRLRALSLLISAVKGTHITVPIVSMRQNQQIEISCSHPLPIHIDGEVFAHPGDGVHQITVSSLPSAIDLMVR